MPTITTGPVLSSADQFNSHKTNEIKFDDHTLSVKSTGAELTQKMKKSDLPLKIESENDPAILSASTGKVKSKKITLKEDITQITAVVANLFLLKSKGCKHIDAESKKALINVAKKLQLDPLDIKKTLEGKVRGSELEQILCKLVKKSTNQVDLRTVITDLLNKPSLSAKMTGIKLQAYLLEYQHGHEKKYFHKKDKAKISDIDKKVEKLNDISIENQKVKVKKITEAMRYVADELFTELKTQQKDWQDSNIQRIRETCFEGFTKKVSAALWKPVSYSTGKEEFGEIMNVLFFASFAGSTSTNLVNLQYGNELNANQLALMETPLATLNERGTQHKLAKGDLGGHMAIFSPLGTGLINQTFQHQVIDAIGYQVTRPSLHVKADVGQITTLQQACETYLSDKGLTGLPGKKAILWSSNKGLLKTGNEQLFSQDNLRGLASALQNKGYKHLIIVGDKAADLANGTMLDKKGQPMKDKKGEQVNIDHLGLGKHENKTPNNLMNIQAAMGKEIKVHDLTEMWKAPALAAIEGQNYIKQIAVFKELQAEGVDLSFGNRSGGMDLIMLSTGIGGVVYDDDPMSHRYFNMTSIAPHMQQIAIDVDHSDFAHKVNQARAGDLEAKMDAATQASAAYQV
ncbi:hypothetical protein [uncultured Shewanella sp.]|uniref:hypothetical protein n=1 Tax=uncultured Shewanella sp. TaxID=173975 RepID=UPI00261CC485|nr:hypothetical protein [uncultured Shewanella sp.]